MPSNMYKKLISVSSAAILLTALTLMLLNYITPLLFYLIAGIAALIAFYVVPKIKD